MHINAVGGDCPGKTELHADVLRGARVIVEFEPQTRIEGDIQQLAADFPVVELWRVLSGEVAGRESDAQVTVFDSVGFALEDFSALRYLNDLVRTEGNRHADRPDRAAVELQGLVLARGIDRHGCKRRTRTKPLSSVA
jgi:ornithine cyclodeaminase/alanine dehydrogenase-like protein (mu-crystallin family)